MDSKYIITSSGNFISEDELYHSWLSKIKRNVKKKFKYIAKVNIGDRIRYFYDKDEYDTYLKAKQINNLDINGLSKTKADITNVNNKKAEYTVKSALLIRKGNVFTDRALDKISQKSLYGIETGRIVKKSINDNGKKLVAQYSFNEVALNIKGSPQRFRADAKSVADSPKSWSELKHKDRKYTKDEDQAAVNPKYPSAEELAKMDPYEYEKQSQYTKNCANCTLAYDIRQRGYDVEAAPYDENETFHPSVENVSKWYKNVNANDWSTFKISEMKPPDKPVDEYTTEDWESIDPFVRRKEILNNANNVLKKMPDNSYGQFCVAWNSGGGHSVVWEKENGKVTIRDCQTNTSFDFNDVLNYTDASNENAFAYTVYVDEIYILRTDDKELTDEALRRIRSVNK